MIESIKKRTPNPAPSISDTGNLTDAQMQVITNTIHDTFDEFDTTRASRIAILEIVKFDYLSTGFTGEDLITNVQLEE